MNNMGDSMLELLETLQSDAWLSAYEPGAEQVAAEEEEEDVDTQCSRFAAEEAAKEAAEEQAAIDEVLSFLEVEKCQEKLNGLCIAYQKYENEVSRCDEEMRQLGDALATMQTQRARAEESRCRTADAISAMLSQ